MFRFFQLIVSVLLLFGGAAGPVPADTGVKVEQLPDSLAEWYKPENKRQVWLHTMFAMRRELQAVEHYAALEDTANLEKWSTRLLDHYRKIPDMVPEWADEVNLDPADALQASVDQAAFRQIGKQTLVLSRACNDCHKKYRVLAALRFRSPDFTGIRITMSDGDEMGMDEYMGKLSYTVNRIKISSEDGFWDDALSAAGILRTQLDSLGDSCRECHRDEMPRERILGIASGETLDRLEHSLEQRQLKDTGRNLGEAAVYICARCHGVHRSLSDVREYLGMP